MEIFIQADRVTEGKKRVTVFGPQAENTKQKAEIY